MVEIVDINNLVHFISDIFIEKTTILYMITRKKVNEQFIYNFVSAQTQNDVAQQLNDSFINQLTKIQSNNKKFLDVEGSSNDYVQFIKVNDVSNAANILETIKNNNPNYFTSDSETFSNIWAYALKIEINNKSLLWFRKYNKGKVLKKGASTQFSLKTGSFPK
ncbi:hypothetical protein [Bacillus sp. EB600]|uniref:hypothetical protein n=1 Tax=Bacillus sp. EB600 TaxID=2806345 RepID=UPI002109870C|nr:hypothetical protein [Bacillus sp. EB600]MCQ6282860.1 hypothetical protein [Bacillus sp. EB600]